MFSTNIFLYYTNQKNQITFSIIQFNNSQSLKNPIQLY